MSIENKIQFLSMVAVVTKDCYHHGHHCRHLLPHLLVIDVGVYQIRTR